MPVRRSAVLPERAYRWNFVALGADITLFSLALTFASVYGVLPLFVHHLTASDVALGLIPSVASIGFLLPPILLVGVVQRLERRKPFIMVCTTIERAPFPILAVLTWVLAREHATALLVCFFALYAVNTLAGGASYAAWLDFIARVMPPNWRGRLFGLWSALGMLLGIGGGVASAAMLGEHSWPGGFSLCFTCATVCLAISYLFLASSRETFAPRHKTGVAPPRPGYAEILRSDRNFAAYLGANCLVTLAGMATAFYTVDAKHVLALSDGGAGLYAAVLMGGSLAGNLLWGYVGDHLGHTRLVEGGALAIAAAAAFALCGHAVGSGFAAFALYAAAFAAVGIGSSGTQLAASALLLDFGQDSSRPAYIGLASLAQLPFACLGPIAGGLLADRLGIAAVFMVSLTMGLAGAAAVGRFVRDPRVTSHSGDQPLT